ncbi:MAG: hypothetical protein ACT4NL_01860 [Pseudomarimonas sp.]
MLTWMVLAALLQATAVQARIRVLPASVEIGMADAIVIGTANQFHAGGTSEPHQVTFAVHRYLRGSGPLKEVLVSLPWGGELEERPGASATKRCAQPVEDNVAEDEAHELERIQVIGGSAPGIRCGERYVLFLGVQPGSEYKLQRAFATHDRQRLRTLRQLLPHVPPWGPPTRGLAALIVTDTPRAAQGEDIELSLGLRNMGDAPIQLHFGGTRKQRSHTTLDIVGPRGVKVAAQPHPALTERSFEEFFAHQSEVKTFTLEPGQTTFLPMESINSARAGWGYKEDFDFHFYPLPARGRYRIVATARRFLPDAAPQTPPLRVVVD